MKTCGKESPLQFGRVATCMAKSALPTCTSVSALPTCSQKPNQIGSMQSKPKRSTSREDATRIPHVHLCHRLLAGGFCGVVAPAATLVFALAACGRFCAVVRAGGAACRGCLLRGSASEASSPRSRSRLLDAPTGGGVQV